MKQVNHLLTGADMAWQAQIGPGLRLYHPTGVVIGQHVVIGSECSIQQGVTVGGAGGHDRIPGDSPIIGNNALLGAGCKIFGPVQVGDNVTVGANAVVVKSIPSGHVAVGVPAVARSVEYRAN